MCLTLLLLQLLRSMGRRNAITWRRSVLLVYDPLSRGALKLREIRHLNLYGGPKP